MLFLLLRPSVLLLRPSVLRLIWLPKTTTSRCSRRWCSGTRPRVPHAKGAVSLPRQSQIDVALDARTNKLRGAAVGGTVKRS